jgi:AraC family transcriptional regulator of adaptative response/methylated-DNA-[protein]-cysteine methyltransferase
MERAIQERDASYDGIFFIAVKTTGIFCRPSCRARTHLPRNRQYFATAQEALQAGFRPCKRCRPLDADGRPPDWVRLLLADVERQPSARLTDADLRRRGIDPARARRFFRMHYGMTFQAFCRGRRMTTALEQLRQGSDLDNVALGNGYESPSGFREAFLKTFGQPPGHCRQADCALMDVLESPVGPLLVAARDDGVCMLEFTDRRTLDRQLAAARRRFGDRVVPGRHRYLDQLRAELAEYFMGARIEFEVPLVYAGTPFQKKVWDGLREIPYGKTMSYEALAEAVGAPGAQRAVGHANGQNRIAIVIPCHRVVNKSGRLGGYGGGLWRKEFLLDLERRGRG